METQSFGQRVKRTTKKIVKIFIITAIIVLVGGFCFLYWGTYED